MSEIGAAVPGGGGEVGELIRAKDWSQTPLGPRDRWSQPLHTSVSICLASRFPMFLWWGHELINVYNDAYIPLMGAKHPDGLGQPAAELWAEVWPILGPLALDVVERGRASWSEAQLLHLERSGLPRGVLFRLRLQPDHGRRRRGRWSARGRLGDHRAGAQRSPPADAVGDRGPGPEDRPCRRGRARGGGRARCRPARSPLRDPVRADRG